MSRADPIPADDPSSSTPDADLGDAALVVPPHPPRYGRLAVVAVLTLLVAAASYWLFVTPDGRQYLDRERLRELGGVVAAWVDRNPVVTLGLFVLAYCVCAVLLLPVWWLQILSGFAFGLWGGIAWVMVSSTCGALATAQVSRWLGEEWVHERIVGNGKAAKRLRRVLAMAGKNGLLVVFISRLSYPIPYGVSNYLFGLLEIRTRDIAIGTAVGGVPVYAGWVAAGAEPAWVGHWQFWAVVVGVNLALLVPLVWHSYRSSRAARKGFPVAPVRVD